MRHSKSRSGSETLKGFCKATDGAPESGRLKKRSLLAQEEQRRRASKNERDQVLGGPKGEAEGRKGKKGGRRGLTEARERDQSKDIKRKTLKVEKDHQNANRVQGGRKRRTGTGRGDWRGDLMGVRIEGRSQANGSGPGTDWCDWCVAIHWGELKGGAVDSVYILHDGPMGPNWSGSAGQFNCPPLHGDCKQAPSHLRSPCHQWPSPFGIQHVHKRYPAPVSEATQRSTAPSAVAGYGAGIAWCVREVNPFL